MPGTPAPSPAATHVALVTCHDIRSLAARKLTGIVTPGRRRDLNMRVDIAIDPACQAEPEAFVNDAVRQAALMGPLRGKTVIATFDATIGLGQVFVRVGGYDEPVATVELIPAKVRAA